MNNETLLLFFVAFTGAAVLLQAIILLAFFLTVRKTVTTLQGQFEEFRTSLVPLLKDSREFLARVGPKIESLTADVADLAHDVRAQSAEVHSSLTEILERVRRQTSRMDAMLGKLLDGVDRAGGFVVEAVNVPIRQFSALAASAKAVMAALRTKSPGPRPPSPADRGRSI
jgi:hypothetical protein